MIQEDPRDPIITTLIDGMPMVLPKNNKAIVVLPSMLLLMYYYAMMSKCMYVTMFSGAYLWWDGKKGGMPLQ